MNFNRAITALGVPAAVWQAALSRVEPDSIAGIRHAPLDGGNPERRIHVADIPEQVNCHFHEKGNEAYEVVAGEGLLHWGAVHPDGNGGMKVDWESPVYVRAGDSFTIPEKRKNAAELGWAHQLERTGEGSLTILFICPDLHLSNNEDRTMLPDAPTLGNKPRGKAGQARRSRKPHRLGVR